VDLTISAGGPFIFFAIFGRAEENSGKNEDSFARLADAAGYDAQWWGQKGVGRAA